MTSTRADWTFLAGLTVLFVEDSSAIRSLISDLLTPLVGRLCLAKNGVEGIEAFHREKPHLLITDLQMPKMNGLDMTEAIRAEHPSLPVVVLTSSDNSRFMLRSIEIGVDRYVLKPVDPQRLTSALLHCAHFLRVEHEERLHRQLERDLAKFRQHEALAILAKGIAHDYNNLLQAILTGVETAQDMIPEGSSAYILLSKTRKYTAVAQDLGRQLLALGQVNDRLREEGPLKPLVKAAIRRILEGTPIHIDLAFDPQLPNVRYNHERLEQALDALLTNAREAMPGGGSLEVRASLVGADGLNLEQVLPRGTFLRLSLKDSGPGVPPELLPRIFDPYQSSRAKANLKGKGLGLAICRSILLAHHGQVTVESRVGEGSTFHLFLPVPAQQ